MKTATGIILLTIFLASCQVKTGDKSSSLPLTGTWQLISGTLIEKGVTTVTDYTKGKSFIKVINDTHFAFFGHDLSGGKDSATALFTCGGGTYSLKDSAYTENLEYCNDRQWEGHSFDFTISIVNDTLVSKGIEKIDSLGVNRLNIERYSRVKK